MFKRYRIIEDFTEDDPKFLSPTCDPAILGVCIQGLRGRRVAYRQHSALALMHAQGHEKYPDHPNPPVFVLMEDDLPLDGIREAIITGFGHPDVIFWDPKLDDAILGICYQHDRSPAVAYDWEKTQQICQDADMRIGEMYLDHTPVLIKVYEDEKA